VGSGFGRAFATDALEAGHTAIGNVRKTSDAAAFAAKAPGQEYPLMLDVTDHAGFPAAVARAQTAAGAIDVLVNNAGNGHEGVLNESSIDDLERQFAAIVFGLLAMINSVLPAMRQRRRGHIVNVTLMGGSNGRA
jgi:NADP-dependent 3-hydroxy acid dehydrogenase YdfG